MRIHRLKTLENYFDLSRRGVKPYEIRENDRLYQRGDTVELYCIRKNNTGIPEIRTAGGTWAPWPLDRFTKLPLKLDMFETDFLNRLERIIAVIDFVLPGSENIGMFDDHVILSIKILDYKGPEEWRTNQPDIFIGADFINQAPAVQTAIPEGVYWSPSKSNFFYGANNLGMSEEFYAKWFDRFHEFPTEVLPEKPRMTKGGKPKA